MAEVPLYVIIPALFTVIAYPMIGLRHEAFPFCVNVAVVTLVTNIGVSFGILNSL